MPTAAKWQTETTFCKCTQSHHFQNMLEKKFVLFCSTCEDVVTVVIVQVTQLKGATDGSHLAKVTFHLPLVN